ncbi:hypothetical protein ACTG2E_18070 [Aeromonas veronii]
MKMHNKALLAIACAAALSACDSEKAANSIAKRVPLALPEAGLYQANLMSRDGDKATPRMIKDLDGLALVYPKGENVQHWGVWVDHQVGKVETNSQWLGQADQKADKDGIYPVQLIRNSERLGTSTALSSVTNDHNLITFQDQPVIDLQGKEIKRWVFDFTRTGTKFSDNSPIYYRFQRSCGGDGPGHQSGDHGQLECHGQRWLQQRHGGQGGYHQQRRQADGGDRVSGGRLYAGGRGECDGRVEQADHDRVWQVQLQAIRCSHADRKPLECRSGPGDG